MTIMRRFFLILAMLVLAATATAGGVLWHRGYRVYVVHTGSMLPTYRPGDAVIDRKPANGYRVGDVITFRSNAGEDSVVTHRVHDIQPSGLRTKGDANRTPDSWTISPTAVQGKVVRVVHAAGFALVYLQQPAGVASLITIVLALALAWRFYFPIEPVPAVDPSPTYQP